MLAKVPQQGVGFANNGLHLSGENLDSVGERVDGQDLRVTNAGEHLGEAGLEADIKGLLGVVVLGVHVPWTDADGRSSGFKLTCRGYCIN